MYIHQMPIADYMTYSQSHSSLFKSRIVQLIIILSGMMTQHSHASNTGHVNGFSGECIIMLEEDTLQIEANCNKCGRHICHSTGFLT